MKKLKLFFAACALLLGVSNASAATDITSTYLTNANLNESPSTGWTLDGTNDMGKGYYENWANDGDVPVVEFYSKWNAGASTPFSPEKTFKFSQTVTMPAGYYRLAVNAFYRNGAGDGTNPDKAWIFVNGTGIEKKQNVTALTAAGVAGYTGTNDLYKAANAFSVGDFSNAFDFTLTAETEVEIGFQGFFNTTLSWCILGPVKLYEYTAADYIEDYRVKVGEAEALYDSPMNAEVLAALKAAVVDEATLVKVDDVTAAINTLNNAINDANASIAVYSSINASISNYATKAALLDETGAAAYDASAIQSKYDNGEYTSVSEAETELSAALLAATKSQTTEGSDWTGVIVNPSFESDFSLGWTNNGMARQNNNSFGKTGTYYAECWEPVGTKSLTQTISGMPAGVYRVSAHSKARGVTSAKIFAAGIDQAITIADSESNYSVEFACDANADVTIGFEGVGTDPKTGSSWLCVDNFTMTLVSAGLPDVVAVEGKMNADIAQAQNDAISSYNANKTVDGYNAAQTAIAAAQASKDAYALMAPHLTKIDAAIAAAETATVGTDDYDAIKTAYNNGTIADNEIQANIKAAYDAVIPVIKSQTAASADFTFAIQNYSFEYGDITGWTITPSSDTGARETSNGTYAATGSDGKFLFNTWWKGSPLTQEVIDVPNGQYTLTASVASDGATIYLIANGEHNEGTETGGTYPSKETFQEATITFLVKNGVAVIGVVGGADGTAGEHKDYVPEGYWWYKADNFRLQKNRDLTPEEEFLLISENGIPAYVPGTYPSVKLAREIKAGFNTLVVPFSMTQAEVEEQFGEGSVVYELKEFEGDVIHFQPADGVTANKPCILKAAKGGSEYSFAGREVAEAAPTDETAGAVTFNGSYAASFTVPANDENYIVSGGKLYLVDSDNVTIAGTRAYFNVVGNQAREISFDGVLTGIATVEKGELKKVFTGDIFDLTGRKVKNPSNGIFVVEGKKVVF